MTNYFTVYPEHCNYLPYKDGYMLHGGKILELADKYAAIEANEWLRGVNQELDGLTVGATDLQFYGAAKTSDLIKVVTKVDSTRFSRITIYVAMFISSDDEVKIFDGYISFCSFRKTSDNTYKLERHTDG